MVARLGIVRMPLQFQNDSLHFGVLLQSILTQLAPNARLLETTKRSADIHDVVAIHPNRASVQPICNRSRLLDVMGPDSGHQAIGGLICPTDHLVDIFEGNDAHDWTKNFFFGNLHIVLNVGKNSGLDEVADISNTFAAANKLRASLCPEFDVAHNPVELCLIYLGNLFRPGIERIAHGANSCSSAALFHELVIDLLFDKYSRPGSTSLALIEEQSEVRTLDGFIQVGIREDDVRILATKFETNSF
jgi:hypothetical protein